jgi:hypothetical protein
MDAVCLATARSVITSRVAIAALERPSAMSSRTARSRALLRRTVPAMVITLVRYVVLAIATATAIRPHYAAPVTVPGDSSAASSSGWVISDFAKSPTGQEFSQDDLYATFRHLPASVQDSANPDAFTTWLAKNGYTKWTSLQPDSRFWEFQLIEGAWLGALSAALIGGSVWLIRRRGA